MRLQHYILINEEETTDLQSLVNMLKRDCKPFIREIKPIGRFLYRGWMPKRMSDLDSYGDNILYYRRKTRTDRKPLDNYRSMHDKFDVAFQERFGWKARSEGIFATGNMDDAHNYGELFLLFPIGEFKFIWSPKILDLYTNIRNHISARLGKSRVPDVDMLADTFTDKNLKDAIISGHEISIKCNEYYLVHLYSIIRLTSTYDFMRML